MGHSLGRMGQPLVVHRIPERKGQEPLVGRMGQLVVDRMGQEPLVVARKGRQLGHRALQVRTGLVVHSRQLEVAVAAVEQEGRHQIRIRPPHRPLLELGWAELVVAVLGLPLVEPELAFLDVVGWVAAALVVGALGLPVLAWVGWQRLG